MSLYVDCPFCSKRRPLAYEGGAPVCGGCGKKLPAAVPLCRPIIEIPEPPRKKSALDEVEAPASYKPGAFTMLRSDLREESAAEQQRSGWFSSMFSVFGGRRCPPGPDPSASDDRPRDGKRNGSTAASDRMAPPSPLTGSAAGGSGPAHQKTQGAGVPPNPSPAPRFSVGEARSTPKVESRESRVESGELRVEGQGTGVSPPLGFAGRCREGNPPLDPPADGGHAIAAAPSGDVGTTAATEPAPQPVPQECKTRELPALPRAGTRAAVPRGLILADGKPVDRLVALMQAARDERAGWLVLHLPPQKAAQLRVMFPQALYNATAHTLRVRPAESGVPAGRVLIVAAASPDMEVAEETRETAVWAGCEAELFVHEDVAGGGHAVPYAAKLADADVVVVVAGMDSPLAAIVAEHIDGPVIAVPTSSGRESSFAGVAALLGMLNSTAPGVLVVAVDAGYRAALAGRTILRRAGRI